MKFSFVGSFYWIFLTFFDNHRRFSTVFDIHYSYFPSKMCQSHQKSCFPLPPSNPKRVITWINRFLYTYNSTFLRLIHFEKMCKTHIKDQTRQHRRKTKHLLVINALLFSFLFTLYFCFSLSIVVPHFFSFELRMSP